jgi:DNA-binding HxlR family transcriptional regulator
MNQRNNSAGLPAQRGYRHFCPLARALELVGERWGLLVVRDLLAGPRRFTDLMRTCGGITPRQLAMRLRQLEEAGIVERDQAPGRREVWYRLTPAGAALRPTVESLLLWGVQHVRRPPSDDEPVRAEHVLNGTRLALDSASKQPSAPLRWVFRLGTETYTLGFDGQRWQLTAGDDGPADVVVHTTARDWARLVMAADDEPTSVDPPRVQGAPGRVREFKSVFGFEA